MGNEKKTICMINSCELTVPAVHGGAIETLINILIDQNEIEHKVDFIVVTNYVQEAELISRKYKYTKFIYIPRDEEQDEKFNRKLDFLRKVLKKCLNGKNCIPYGWKHFELIRNFKLRHLKTDYIVAEGGTYYSFKYFSKRFGRDKLYLHVHHELFADELLDNIFGHIIGVSNFALQQYMSRSSLPPDRGRVVYNCIDEDVFINTISDDERYGLRKQLGLEKDDYIVIYSGRIVPEKGVEQLINAILSLPKENIKLIIAGGIRSALGGVSDYYKKIIRMIEQSERRIKYLGYLDNALMYKYYQMSDVQVVPSIWEEVAGLVTIEGMLSGIPLIVTNSGGMVEYVADDSIIKVERGEQLTQNIAAAIMHLYNNPQEARQRGEKEREYAMRFSKRKYYIEYLKAFGIE